jgi:spore cortex biosynthesis protein YabQ
VNGAIVIELRFFGASIFWGMLLLIIYDSIRILRRIVKHNEFFVGIQDILYWVTCSLLIFHMMYQQNDGIIRGFSILGMLLGMLGYHTILSDFLVKFISSIINKIINFFIRIIWFILKPIRFLIKRVGYLLTGIIKILKKVYRNLLNTLKKMWKSDKIAVSENEKR